MPKFVDLATNAPPVDPSLVKTNIIPTFRDVAPPQFVDDEPEKAPIELLAERIDTDPKFVPSNEQLDEYFDYKDKQPFSFSKVRDFAVNTVGALITDVGKAVASAANDPDFVLGPGTKLISYLAGGADPETAAKATLAGPAKRAVTTAEAAARGTWDLSILGKQLTDKMEELNKDSWSGWADFAVEEHNKKYPKNKITKTGLYHDGYKEINPGDLQKLKAKWGKTKNQARRDAWRTMRYMINTRANAAEGKQTILSEFFDKDVDKSLRPFINNNVAEGGSYVLDASAPVGFLAAPMKAGAKAPVTSLLVTKAGEMVKAGGKKAESAAELLSSKFKSLQDEIIETELPQPKQIGALETGARIFTVAGDGLEALGRAAGQPRTLESTLERAGRTAETQAARRALKTASKFDPLLDTVGSLVSGAKAGTLSGLALTLPTGDEEMIGGAIGSGVAVGGAGGLAGRFAGKKQITQKQVENTVNEWLSSKSPEERQNIQKLGLTPAEAGNVAVAELLGRGIIGKDKLSDVNFVYLSQDDYLKRFHPEVLVDGKAPADTPFGTRGAQSSVDGTPTVFINTGYNGARSIFHELMHGLLRFDELQDSRAELRSYLFDSKTPDGEVIKKGWFEDGDLDTQFDAYLTMLPEESSAPFLEQFNVYKDVETESGPQRVIDEEATRDRQREYIMEELEAESFANFIQQSGPTFLQQTRSISQKLLDRWFLQDNIRKTGIMKAILGRSGVEFGADGNPTGLFYRDGKPFTNSPELNKLIRDFVRAKDTVNKRMVEDDAGERPAMTIGGRQAKAGRKQIEAAIKSEDGAKVVQHFQNNDIFARDQSGKIVYDVNGVPILLGRKEIEKLQANRREQIMDKLSEVGADPNGMVQDSNGSWRGVPTNKQLRAILEVPDSIIAPGMKDTIRDIARKFKTPGQSIIIDYNPALNKSGVYDSNLSSGLRIAVPLSFKVSKSGNFYMTTLDVGAMNMKMADWAKTGQLKSWDGDTKRFYQDVYKYLENHQKDAPGETGIGVDKRNIINDFFGVTADNVNPITDARKAAEASMSPGKRSKAKASANLIRSRRFDRINRIEKNRVSKQAAGTPLPMKSQSDAYRKMQKNLMPGDRSRFMPGEKSRSAKVKDIEAEVNRTVESEKNKIKVTKLSEDDFDPDDMFSESFDVVANGIDVSASINKNKESGLYDVFYSKFGEQAGERDTAKSYEEALRYAKEEIALEVEDYHSDIVNRYRKGELIDDISLPDGWEVDEVIDSSGGSIYYKLREDVEYDADGDLIDYNEYKVRIADHDPSVFREKEFGSNDFNVEVEDSSARELSRAIGEVEKWAQRKSRQSGEQPKFMPAERNDRKNRVSTRLPTAVAATEDPLASTLLIDSAAVFNLPPEKQKVMAGIITKYPNIKTSSKNLQPVADELMQQSIDNLLWLHDKVPADIRKRSKLWYDGARKITNGYTKEFQITNPAGAGVLAVLSPGKDWFMNVSLAERIIDTAQNKVGKPIDAKMMKQAKFRLEGNAALMNEVKKMVGKKYNNLTPLQKAIWIRMYDEAYNSPNYEIISPEGRKVGLVKKKDGTNANVAHQSFPFIQKAIAVLDDPSRENISGQLGGAHKIRNFYNNILLPKIAKEDVTIDTHAVAAALLRPFAQKSTEVTHNFGAGMPGSSITGAQGTYGIYADAYREAARQRGILPREMQSITWEAVRGLFPNTMKTEKNKALADAIWTDYKRGRKTIDEARKEIEKLFGGIDAPDWYR